MNSAPHHVRQRLQVLKTRSERSFDMTEKYYIDDAQSRVAGRELAALLAAGSRD
jgi:hypothetical protein